MSGRRRVRASIAVAILAGCGQTSSSSSIDAGQEDADHGAHLDAGVPRPDSGLPPPMGPALLSQTGLYADFGARRLADGVRRFTPRHPLWTDGSEKQRYLLLPPSATIDTSDMDLWRFPVGTKVWKDFRVGGTLVETRLLEKVRNAQVVDAWFMMAYLWRGDGTDADAVPDGVENASGTTHDVPKLDDCAMCHMHLSDAPIGVSAIELSAEGGRGDLTALAEAGLLSHPPGREFDPPGKGIVQQALGYLHGNCGYCHTPSAFFASKIVLRTRLAIGDVDPTMTAAYRTGINKQAIHEFPAGVRLVITPGDPDHSQLYGRMLVRGLESMPPLATKKPDTAGLSLMREWILSLPP